MDRQLEKKAWYIRHKYYVMAGIVVIGVAIYTIALQFAPERQKVEEDALGLAIVEKSDFLEYVEQEGLVQPLVALKINTRVAGAVERIVAEEGSRVNQGDTILVLSNPDLQNEISEQEEALQKQLIGYRQQEIEMEQATLSLRKQVLQNNYDLKQVADNYKLSQEEFSMGIKSKAELEVARQEYEFKMSTAKLEQERLVHDSAAAVIRRSLIETNRRQDIKKFERVKAKREQLIVRSPVTGQLSSLTAELGQQIGGGAQVGEVKAPDRFKVRITPGEYYIDRIMTGQPARATYKGVQYGMMVRRVVPEVKDRTFTVELAFSDSVPSSLRIGQSIRTQIELDNTEATIIIPRGDFYSATGGQWIYRVVPGEKRAVRVPIRIGRQNPRQFEVLEGLQAGDEVITTGYSKYGEVEELSW